MISRRARLPGAGVLRSVRLSTSPLFLFLALVRHRSSAVDGFVADWGEDMLGPLAGLLPIAAGDGACGSEVSTDRGGVSRQGLAELWPRLSKIREGLEDMDASRAKVELARQMAVDSFYPGSIAHALTKVREALGRVTYRSSGFIS